MKEEFVSLAVGLDDYLDILALDERSTMSPVRWWVCHGANGVHLQTLAIHVLSHVASSSSAEKNWSTYGFIYYVKRNRLGSQKAEDLVYVHSMWKLNPSDRTIALTKLLINLQICTQRRLKLEHNTNMY